MEYNANTTVYSALMLTENEYIASVQSIIKRYCAGSGRHLLSRRLNFYIAVRLNQIGTDPQLVAFMQAIGQELLVEDYRICILTNSHCKGFAVAVSTKREKINEFRKRVRGKLYHFVICVHVNSYSVP